MRAREEFTSFVKGTRPRPPLGPPQPIACVFFVAASLGQLPLVYLIVRSGAFPPIFTIVLGLLSIGLAWSGGVLLEGRRVGTAKAIGALGVLEAGVAMLPELADAMGDARWGFLMVATLAAAGLVAIARGPGTPAGRPMRG